MQWHLAGYLVSGGHRHPAAVLAAHGAGDDGQRRLGVPCALASTNYSVAYISFFYYCHYLTHSLTHSCYMFHIVFYLCVFSFLSVIGGRAQ